MTQNPFSGVSSPQNLLMIAPDVFMPALQPLVQHKNQSGMPTVAVSISSLGFFQGIDHPESIKKAIQYAHENLSTKYVMLVGDAHMCPVRFMFYHCLSGKDWVPNVHIPIDGDYFASDLYYSNLYHHTFLPIPPYALPGGFDNWDANGNGKYNEATWLDPNSLTTTNPDNVDGYPDVAVGRVPAHSVADVSAYVNKIISYELSATRYDASRTRVFTFVADQQYPTAVSDTNDILTKSRMMQLGSRPRSVNFLLIENGNFVNNKYVFNTPPQNWTNALGSDVANFAILSDWVSYEGHGWEHGWGQDGGGQEDLTPFDLPNTANSNALPIIFAAGCSTGAFIGDFPWRYEYRGMELGAPHHIIKLFLRLSLKEGIQGSQESTGVTQSARSFIAQLAGFSPPISLFDFINKHWAQSHMHTSSVPVHPSMIKDMVTGQIWEVNSLARCPSNPLIMPTPNMYDFDRSNTDNFNQWNNTFAYSWLINPANDPTHRDALGGAIAYFGEIGIAEDWMGAELQTYMLAAYANEVSPNLGDIYLEAQQQYWRNHQNDTGNSHDFHSVSRFYLGWMVFFGDPSLRLPSLG